MSGLIMVKLKQYKQMIVPIVIMTAMSLVFTYFFGVGFGGGYEPTVYIVNEEENDLTNKMVENLKAIEGFNFKEESLEKSRRNLVEIDGAGIIHFKKGFTESLLKGEGKVYFYKQGEAVEHRTITNGLSEVVNRVLGDIATSKILMEYYQRVGVEISEEEIFEIIQSYRNKYKSLSIVSSTFESDANRYDTQKHYFAGFMLFFSLFVVTFGIGMIIDEKTYHVFDRMSVSPLSPIKVIISNIIVNFIVSMGQLGFVMSVAKYVMGIDISGNLILLLLVLAVYVIAGTAIGLFISTFVKNQQQLAAILPTVIVSTSMIGGLMWPLEIINSKILLFLADLVPQRWALLGVEKIIIYNGSFSDISKPLMVLGLITIVFSIGTVIGYKRVNLAK